MLAFSLFDRLCTVKETRECTVIPPKNRRKRGLVAGASRASRNRLLKLLSMVGRFDPALFVTLTFHENVTDHATYATAFHAFRDNVAKQYSDLCGVWRLAEQRRGAAHFHLLLWGWGGGEDALESAELRLRRAWLSATDQHGDYAAVRHAVDVRVVSDFRACGFYLALYQSGQAEHGSGLRGRAWGIIRRDRLALCPIEGGSLSEAQGRRLRRILRTAQRKRRGLSRRSFAAKKGRGPLGRRDGSFSAFLPIEVSTRLLRFLTSQSCEPECYPHLYLERVERSPNTFPTTAETGHARTGANAKTGKPIT